MPLTVVHGDTALAQWRAMTIVRDPDTGEEISRTPVDLTGATIQVTVKPKGTASAVSVVGTPKAGAEGIAGYWTHPYDTFPVGTLKMQAHLTSDGVLVTAPTLADEVIIVRAAI